MALRRTILLFFVLSAQYVTTFESNDDNVDTPATLIYGTQHGARKDEIKTASKYQSGRPASAEVPRTPMTKGFQTVSGKDFSTAHLSAPKHLPTYFSTRGVVEDQNLAQSKDYDTSGATRELTTDKKHGMGLIRTVLGKGPNRKTVLKDDIPRLTKIEQSDTTTSTALTTNILGHVTSNHDLGDQIYTTGKSSDARSTKKGLNFEKHDTNDPVSEPHSNPFLTSTFDKEPPGQFKDQQSDIAGFLNEKHNINDDDITEQSEDHASTNTKQNMNLKKQLDRDILFARPEHRVLHAVKTSRESSDNTLMKHFSIPNIVNTNHNDNHDVSFAEVNDYIPPGHDDKSLAEVNDYIPPGHDDKSLAEVNDYIPPGHDDKSLAQVNDYIASGHDDKSLAGVNNYIPPGHDDKSLAEVNDYIPPGLDDKSLAQVNDYSPPGHDDKSLAEVNDYIAPGHDDKSLAKVNDYIPPGHDDKFLCPPCQCSYTHKMKIIANCSNPHFIKIPTELPKKVWRLNVLKTNMTTFNISDTLIYPSLFMLSVTANLRLIQIQNSTLSINKTSEITVLDLSSNNINSIDDRSFVLMPSLQNLTLRLNKIRTITNFTFEGLSNLRHLDVSLNNLTNLEPGIFDQLQSLKTLHLGRNELMGYIERYIPPQLFKNQQKLKSLSLQGCSSSRENWYPNKALGHLTNLQELYIDGINDNVEFGDEMKSLTHFTHLEIGTNHGNCLIKTMKKSFFKNLPYLKKFKMRDCPLHYVEEDAFSGAKQLESLSLVFMKSYDLFQAFDDLKGLQNSSLKSLAFVHLFHSAYPCRFLRYNQSIYLRNIELEELDISNNRLSLLDDDFCRNLPRTLKRLILRHNHFTLIAYILNRIPFLTNLILIDLTGQNDFAEFQFHTPLYSWEGTENTSALTKDAHSVEDAVPYCTHESDDDGHTHSHIPKGFLKINENTKANILDGNSELTVGIRDFKNSYFSDTDYDVQVDNADLLHVKNVGKKMIFPPKLKILRAARYSNFGRTVLHHYKYDTSNHLEQIDFSSNFLSSLRHDYQMTPYVRVANLDGNFLTSMSYNLFPQNSSLVHLSMKNNVLGNAFAKDKKGKLLVKLEKLVYLDISSNMIFKLHKTFFKGLISLSTLKVSDNKLQVINTRFSHMTSLNYIDFSKNSIMWISKESRDDLDELATSLWHQHQLLRIDLTMNPLPCTCGALEILHWMATTNVYLLSKDYLYCRLENGTITEMGDIGERFRAVQKECRSKAFIIFSCIATIVFLGILVTFAMMYHFRWKLRYLRHIALAKLLGYKPKVAEVGKFKYDAFFLYGEESRRFVLRYCRQELQEKRGHTLCLDEIDFLPGTLSMSNIVSAIQNSTKTIVVGTPELYEDEYAEYGVKMAFMEEIYKSRKLLHLCIYQPISVDDMGDYPDLLMLMKRNDYTEYPPEDEISEEIRQNFWDQLSQTIGHTDNREEDLDDTVQQE